MAEQALEEQAKNILKEFKQVEKTKKKDKEKYEKFIRSL